MIVKTEIYDLANFEAWSGGEYTKDKIVEAGLGEDFMEALEDNYPDGMTESELNDLLWFEDEWCYELVGLNSHGVTPLRGSDILDNTTIIGHAIELRIEEYNTAHNTERYRGYNSARYPGYQLRMGCRKGKTQCSRCNGLFRRSACRRGLRCTLG